MITHWYVGFIGDYPHRSRMWFDIFTTPEFRHVLAIGYDPVNCVWVLFDTAINGTVVDILHPDDPLLNVTIATVKKYGKWLKFKPTLRTCPFGRFWHYCVPSIKHLLGLRSSALTPKGLYRDLVRVGAQPAFE